MVNDLESRLSQEVARYLAGEITLQFLEDWIVQESWGQQLSPTVARLELLLAEQSSGFCSEADIRAFLFTTQAS